MNGRVQLARRASGAILACVFLVSCKAADGTASSGVQVEVSPATATVVIGSSLPLTAVVRNASGTALPGRLIAWSSSDTVRATVSSAGLLAARAVGVVRIAASSQGQSATATITVIDRSVATVQVSPAAASVRVGATVPLSVRLTDAEGVVLTGRAVSWGSASTAIATVDAEGVVTGRGAGSTSITATSEGRSGSAVVTVTVPPIASIAVAPLTSTLLVGASTTLSATPRDADGNVLAGRGIVWSVANPAIAIVSSSGLVSAVSPGTTTVQASAEGRSGTATVIVQPQPVATVGLNPISSVVNPGATLQLVATTFDITGATLSGRSVTFVSSNATIASVDITGLVTARAVGTATITATSEGKSAAASIRVDPVPVASVTLVPVTAMVSIGSTITLAVTARSGAGVVLTGRPITWRSLAPTVATVSGSGVVTGLAEGTAVISADIEGVLATATITVRLPAVSTVEVTPPIATLAVNASQQLAATLRDDRGNVLSRSVTWTSSDDAVAFVTSSGNVIALRAGVATITATSEGKSGTASITVR